MLNWLILGGGIQGTYLSHVLRRTCEVPAEKIRVLDPEAEALAGWMRCTKNTGMTYLRSPMVHHIDLAPASLKHFSKKWREGRVSIAPYERPKLAMFNAHCRHVIESNGLDELRVQGRALEMTLEENHVAVETDGGVLRARRVVTALGAAPPRRPDWAHTMVRDGGVVHHLFDPDFCSDCLEVDGLTVVVGAGISAAQFALKALARGGEKVIIVAKNPPLVHQFDADPGWLGPKYMNRFSRERDVVVRRRLIRGARYRGSMPSDVYRRMERARRAGDLVWLQGTVDQAVWEGGSAVMRVADQTLVADRVILATGFEVAPPGQSMIQALAKRHQLPLSPCGYPETDRFLRWHPRLFTAGALGELTLGPVARNIAGGRRAGNLLSYLMKRA
ncbi:FAD/NAD(P)-binding protein [Acanthopleuribacter pedis]|uniref:FAD/NAD(P)-binding protein n=1 Tax=Acanthopleuribacter pedis TaxID=442870 RepID=A0A8J7QEV5_9BACT|nr:FAD/NAD(P)-binding protein [Acanthopleuribacter pedis]MBO1318485.1 FAD/NAD(P)-binding protein [Acanthopleuribacter pedis]